MEPKGSAGGNVHWENEGIPAAVLPVVVETDATPARGQSAEPVIAADGDDPQLAELLAKLDQQNRLLESDEKAVVFACTPVARASPGPPHVGWIDSETQSETTEPSLDPDEELLYTGIVEWADTISHWDMYVKRPKQLAAVVYRGIPDPLRGMVWQRLSSVYRAQNPVRRSTSSLLPTTPSTPGLAGGPSGATADTPCYHDLLQLESPHDKAIKLDLARTYPSHEFFKADGIGQTGMYNVIKAYSVYDTEVGYCQGTPFVVGLLILHLPEEECFHMTVTIMRDYKLRGLFRSNMADMPLRLFQLDGLLQALQPDVHAHLADLGISTSAYASQWFLTLFGNTLPLPVALRVLDVFMLEGVAAIFRAALAIFRHNSDFLLRQDFEHVLAFLAPSSLAERYEGQENQLLEVMTHVTIPPKLLPKLEKDYAVTKEREAAEESELHLSKKECARLQAENVELRRKVAGLEQETSLLAQRLLEKSVALGEREEELFDLQVRTGNVPASVQLEMSHFAAHHKTAAAASSRPTSPVPGTATLVSPMPVAAGTAAGGLGTLLTSAMTTPSQPPLEATTGETGQRSVDMLCTPSLSGRGQTPTPTGADSRTTMSCEVGTVHALDALKRSPDASH